MITLGIIGVVAAMTLPTLIQNHQKQTYVTGLKKAYSVLQNAFAQMALDEDVTEWSQTYCGSAPSSNECFNRIKKQFNVIETNNLNEYCSHFNDYSSKQYFYTSDGMLYLYTYGVLMLVDINGDKGPNIYGRDQFTFEISYNRNKIEPYGASLGVDYQTECTPEKLKQNETNGEYCTGKVLIEGKMDY